MRNAHKVFSDVFFFFLLKWRLYFVTLHRSTACTIVFFSSFCPTCLPIFKRTHLHVLTCTCAQNSDCFIINVHHCVTFIIIWQQSAIAKINSKMHMIRFCLQCDKIHWNFEWILNLCVCNTNLWPFVGTFLFQHQISDAVQAFANENSTSFFRRDFY